MDLASFEIHVRAPQPSEFRAPQACEYGRQQQRPVETDTGAVIVDIRGPEAPPSRTIKSSRHFVAAFVPPDFTVDGLLQEGFLYSLTGATGAGNTLRLAASMAQGEEFAGRATKKKRVLYLAAENPDDVRMRW